MKRRVNGPLSLRFQFSGLSSYAGLELVRRYFASTHLAQRIRRHLSRKVPGTDYGVVSMILLLLALLIAGGRRLRHLLYLEDDPVVRRFCGLRRLPTPRSVGRWLARWNAPHVDALSGINDEVVAETVRRSGLRRLTLDVDGSVVSTGQKVEAARRGFNPHHRKVPSYYPVTAYEAQTGQILRVKNRPGNVHDGKAGVAFLHDLFAQVRDTIGRSYLLEFRMDGAFFRRDVLELLEQQRTEFAIKVPFYEWVGLQQIIRSQPRWSRVDATVHCFERHLPLRPWGKTLRVVVYRKKVQHWTRKNYQLDLFDPSDGHYEYSALVTNKRLTGRYLWHFMCGRGCHEKVYAELRNGFAFDCVPSQKFGANSAWQVLSVLAFNLMRGFQVATTAPRRSANRKRRTIHRFESIHTLRYQFIHRAGVLVHPNGRSTLDVGTSDVVTQRFTAIDRRLAKAA